MVCLVLEAIPLIKKKQLCGSDRPTRRQKAACRPPWRSPWQHDLFRYTTSADNLVPVGLLDNKNAWDCQVHENVKTFAFFEWAYHRLPSNYQNFFTFSLTLYSHWVDKLFFWYSLLGHFLLVGTKCRCPTTSWSIKQFTFQANETLGGV